MLQTLFFWGCVREEENRSGSFKQNIAILLTHLTESEAIKLLSYCNGELLNELDTYAQTKVLIHR